MKWAQDTPCKTCPYRRDVAIGTWHPLEFAKLLGEDRSELGAVYQCHVTRRLPEAERDVCAGWLLDQKRRDAPSIMLRMQLRKADAAALYNRIHAGGVELYASIEAMCRANGVRPPSGRRLAREP